MTTLNGLITVFLSDVGLSWQSYAQVAGVAWWGVDAVENSDVADPAHKFVRSGVMRLAGFGEIDLPDGASGADAGVRHSHGGECGVTLSGDAERVNGIAVVKFHPEDDHARVLAGQFAVGTTIALIADDCALDETTRAANTQGNVFFRVDIESRSVFVEAFNDEDAGARGPGAATYVFYRVKPTERISSMACREV